MFISKPIKRKSTIILGLQRTKSDCLHIWMVLILLSSKSHSWNRSRCSYVDIQPSSCPLKNNTYDTKDFQLDTVFESLVISISKWAYKLLLFSTDIKTSYIQNIMGYINVIKIHIDTICALTCLTNFALISYLALISDISTFQLLCELYYLLLNREYSPFL